MMEWMPIETFDYKSESGRQKVYFIWVIVSDGEDVAMATYLPEEKEWRDYYYSDKLAFIPTHWMRMPSPPSAHGH